jgi:hypothetical protein
VDGGITTSIMLPFSSELKIDSFTENEALATFTEELFFSNFTVGILEI